MSDKVRKPRTATERPLNKMMKNHNGDPHCPYDDGTRWKECGCAWANKCDGNIFKCCHLKLQHNASLGPNSENKKDFA